MVKEEILNLKDGDRIQKSKYLVWTVIGEPNWSRNSGYYVQATCGRPPMEYRSISEEELLGFSLLK